MCTPPQVLPSLSPYPSLACYTQANIPHTSRHILASLPVRPLTSLRAFTNAQLLILSLEFQRLYTPNAFREERILWRAVIQLNIVRSIHTILDTISDIRRRDMFPNTPYTSDPDSDSESEHHVALPPHLEELRRRLYPLRHVESLLIAKLCPPNEHEATSLGYGGANSVNGNVPLPWGQPPSHVLHNNEVFVRPGASWKTRSTGRPLSAGTTGQETIDECQTMLHHCRSDIMALWNDSVVRQILRRRKIRLEESPGL